MTTLLWIFALLAALAVSAFAVQNAEAVQMRFLGWHTLTSLPVVIFIAAALGAILAGVLAGVSLLRMRRAMNHLRDEVSRLRNAAPPPPPPAAPPPEPPAAEEPAPPPASPPGDPPAG